MTLLLNETRFVIVRGANASCAKIKYLKDYKVAPMIFTEDVEQAMQLEDGEASLILDSFKCLDPEGIHFHKVISFRGY